MTPAGQRVKVTAQEREDYEGTELVTRDGEGRPIMSVEVERNDGTDLSVFAPAAQMELD